MGKFVKRYFQNSERLFNLALQGRRLPNIFIYIPIILLVLYGSGWVMNQHFITSFIHLVVPPDQGNITDAVSFMLGNLILIRGMSLLLILLWVRVIEGRKLYTLGLSLTGIFHKYLKGFLIGFAIISLSALALYIIGAVSLTWAGVNSFIWGVIILLPGWLVQGAMEEIMLRGWLFPVFGAKYGIIGGILVSSCLFGILHLFNSNFSIISCANIVLFGIFAIVYLNYNGNLWGICALHTAWNWSENNIFGFNISGVTPKGGSLFITGNTGSNIMTGGSFGPEGGIIITIILIMFTGLFIWLTIRRESLSNSK